LGHVAEPLMATKMILLMSQQHSHQQCLLWALPLIASTARMKEAHRYL
jgi:hypothetical protein